MKRGRSLWSHCLHQPEPIFVRLTSVRFPDVCRVLIAPTPRRNGLFREFLPLRDAISIPPAATKRGIAKRHISLRRLDSVASQQAEAAVKSYTSCPLPWLS